MRVVADLHVHTTASDGRATLEQVMQTAALRGLHALTITDHSTVTWRGVRTVAARYGIECPFPAVEVSTVMEGRRHHIVLYGFNLLIADVARTLAHPNNVKNLIAERVRECFVDMGIEMPPMDEIRQTKVNSDRVSYTLSPESTVASRSGIAWHVSQLEDVGFERAYRRVVEVYTSVEKEYGPARYLNTIELVSMARSKGLFAALAHPLWRCRTEADVSQALSDMERMVDAGLAGADTRSYHNPTFDDHPLLLAAMERLSLTRAAGSDYHANGKTELGANGLSADAYAAFIQEVGSERG